MLSCLTCVMFPNLASKSEAISISDSSLKQYVRSEQDLEAGTSSRRMSSMSASVTRSVLDFERVLSAMVPCLVQMLVPGLIWALDPDDDKQKLFNLANIPPSLGLFWTFAKIT